MAPSGAPFSCSPLEPRTRRNAPGCPCPGSGPSSFSAQSRARCFQRRHSRAWASKSSRWYDSDHAR
eukprot:13330282-Alexandrium_andersonii.AAC.1